MNFFVILLNRHSRGPQLITCQTEFRLIRLTCGRHRGRMCRSHPQWAIVQASAAFPESFNAH